MKRVFLIFAIVAMAVSVARGQSQVEKSAVPGITNFAQVKTTVACAGAVTPTSVAGIKKMGFASIINLRLASEQGADIDGKRWQLRPLESTSYICRPTEGCLTPPWPIVLSSPSPNPRTFRRSFIAPRATAQRPCG
jgi:hypothetical protein